MALRWGPAHLNPSGMSGAEGFALRLALVQGTWAGYPGENKSEGAEGSCLWSSA